MTQAMIIAPVGEAVPDTAHAVSVSLPTWRANVGYEEGEEWVVGKMKTGYPRFFIHLIIQELEREILKLYGQLNEKVMLFPTRTTASRCQAFFYNRRQDLPRSKVRVLHLEPNLSKAQIAGNVVSKLSCVFFPAEEVSTAKQVWQHSGDGIQSRRGEFCLQALREGWLVPAQVPNKPCVTDIFSKGGPRRYQSRGISQSDIFIQTNGLQNGIDGEHNTGGDLKDYATFIEERFGRNLNAELAAKAKMAVKKRIAGCLTDDTELDESLVRSSHSPDCVSNEAPISQRLRHVSEDDVYLYPCGMNAIFNAHQIAMKHGIGQDVYGLKSICFGFPYIDTLKVLEKWGPGALFYGNADQRDLDDLEARLRSGERYAALFTEFPSNPLLRSPDLRTLRRLADQYHFVLVVDETVGNYINLDVISHVDVVVSSLTKIFSGDCNVMGGSLVLNEASPIYNNLRDILEQQYEDNVWAEDAVYLERNSRDFVSRIERINVNAEAMTEELKKSDLVKEVYYPKLVDSKHLYDEFRTPNGGYGGLFSVTFHTQRDAQVFFDNLNIQKGPSLGTNFTLSCPFVLLAHYNELDWARSYGVDPDLVRVSVGLEEPEELIQIVRYALNCVRSPLQP